MYAIISDGGRQYRVEEGQEMDVDLRDGEAGAEVSFDRVLLLGNDDGVKVGTPTVEGVSVTAEVVGVTRGEKIYVQKFRRRKNSRTRTGHRQYFTRIRISKIGE